MTPVAPLFRKLDEENKRYREALVFALEKRAEALGIIEQNGFVFESIGKEPGNWQHLAFTLYSMLCEIESTTAAALTEEEDCEHEWVDATNSVVESGVICAKCHAIAASS